MTAGELKSIVDDQLKTANARRTMRRDVLSEVRFVLDFRVLDRVIDERGVKLLVFDEIHNVKVGRPRPPRRIRLKWGGSRDTLCPVSAAQRDAAGTIGCGREGPRGWVKTALVTNEGGLALDGVWLCSGLDASRWWIEYSQGRGKVDYATFES